MFHPTRGGVRGGQDQFSWETVKEDKYREYYLGHSVHAPVGRWQKGRDLHWYVKEKRRTGELDDQEAKLRKLELQKIKEQEAEVLAVALGFKKALPTDSVASADLMAILRKEQTTVNEEGDMLTQAKAIHGLGFKESGRYEAADKAAEEKIAEAKNPVLEEVKNTITSAEKEAKAEKKSKKRRHRHKSDEETEKHERREHRKARKESPRKHRKRSRSRESPRRHRNRSRSRDKYRR